MQRHWFASLRGLVFLRLKKVLAVCQVPYKLNPGKLQHLYLLYPIGYFAFWYNSSGKLWQKDKLLTSVFWLCYVPSVIVPLKYLKDNCKLRSQFFLYTTSFLNAFLLLSAENISRASLMKIGL